MPFPNHRVVQATIFGFDEKLVETGNGREPPVDSGCFQPLCALRLHKLVELSGIDFLRWFMVL
jgi:hypothetical protein